MRGCGGPPPPPHPPVTTQEGGWRRRGEGEKRGGGGKGRRRGKGMGRRWGEGEEGRVICSFLTFYGTLHFCFQHNYCCTFCCFSFAVFKKKHIHKPFTPPLHTFLNALKLITRNSDLICFEYCNSGFFFSPPRSAKPLTCYCGNRSISVSS